MLLLHSISRSLLSRDHSHTSYCGKPTPAFDGAMQYGSLFRLRDRNSCYIVRHTIQARIRNENSKMKYYANSLHTTDIESHKYDHQAFNGEPCFRLVSNSGTAASA